MGSEIGSLEVTVVDAVQLPVVNHIGKQNPFVVLIVGAQRLKTKPSKTGHRNPVWGERLNFTLEQGTTEMGLDVFHDSKLGKPGFIGTAVVPLSQVLATGTSSRRVRLGDAGEIRLQIAFTRSTQVSNGATQASLAGQALQNASNSLAAAMPSQSLPAGSPWSSRKSMQAEIDGPAWLSGQSTSKPQGIPATRPAASVNAHSQAAPVEDAGAESGAEEGAMTEASQPPDMSRWGSLGAPRAATSPQKSFRAKFGHKLGNFWYGKDGQRGSATNPEALSMPPKPSAPLSESGAEGAPQAECSSAVSSRLPSGTVEVATEAPSDARFKGHDSGQSRQGGTRQSSLMPGWSESWQGFRMEPVEAVQSTQPDGTQGWLNTWEQRLGNPSRRATDSGSSLIDDDSQAIMQAPRRQTDSAFVAPSMQGEGEGDDGNERFYRTGCQFREWGERRLPSALGTEFGRAGSSFWQQPSLWDGRAQHERMLTAMEERMRSSTTQQIGQPPEMLGSGERGHSFTRGGSNIMAPGPRITEASAIDSSHSTGEIGRQRQQMGQAAEERLDVERSQRSDSAPASVDQRQGQATVAESNSAATSGYPTPRFDDENDIANRFSSLGGPGSPPVFATAVNSRPQAGVSPEGQANARQISTAAGRPPRVLGFDDTSYLEPRRETGTAENRPPASFVGMVSPFAEDTSPLENESPESSEGPTIRHARSKSAGRGVPIKEVRQEIEAAAGGSVRIADNAAAASGDSQQSLTALLSDSKNDWLIDEKDLEIAVDERGRPIKLGSGSFGTVYKGIYDHSTEVAIKTLKCETKKDMDAALYEVAILKKQLHPNVVQFLGASIGETSIQLVTELLAGNLHTALRQDRCTWHKGGKGVAKNIASALSFLHKKKVVHLDVKSANILLTSNKTAKLADLGLSAMMNTNSFVDTIKGLGTLQWTSPEVLLGSHAVTCASDVFSFGVVLWEICTGDPPQRGKLRKLEPGEAPPEISDLIWQCLDSDPKQRPSMQQAFNVLSAT